MTLPLDRLLHLCLRGFIQLLRASWRYRHFGGRPDSGSGSCVRLLAVAAFYFLSPASWRTLVCWGRGRCHFAFYVGWIPPFLYALSLLPVLDTVKMTEGRSSIRPKATHCPVVRYFLAKFVAVTSILDHGPSSSSWNEVKTGSIRPARKITDGYRRSLPVVNELRSSQSKYQRPLPPARL